MINALVIFYCVQHLQIFIMMKGVHSRSGGTMGNWVGNQLPAGWTTRLE